MGFELIVLLPALNGVCAALALGVIGIMCLCSRGRAKALWIAVAFTLVYPFAMTLWMYVTVSVLVSPPVPGPLVLMPLHVLVIMVPLSLAASAAYGVAFRSKAIAIAPQVANVAVVLASLLCAQPSWRLWSGIDPLVGWFLPLLWLCVFGAVAIGTVVAEARPMASSGTCAKCGYDLSGLAPGSACPECAALPAPQIAPMVGDTVFCGKCWYDRSGLRPGVKCPNCGARPE